MVARGTKEELVNMLFCAKPFSFFATAARVSIGRVKKQFASFLEKADFEGTLGLSCH